MCAPKAPKVQPVPVRQTQKLPDGNGTGLSPASVKRQRVSSGMMALSAASGIKTPNVTKLGG